jgi:hypothetical protein
MSSKRKKKTGWWVSKPRNGIIEVVRAKSGKVVCTLDVSDFKDEKRALLTANLIATLPKLVTPQLLIKLAILLPDD